MFRNFFKFFFKTLSIIVIIYAQNEQPLQHKINSKEHIHHIQKQNFSLLINFTCATAKDELEKHPEMRTIAMVELENDFPSEFSAKVLKCLPTDVAKIIINPHTHTDVNPNRNINSTLMLPKETFVIYVAHLVELKDTFVKKVFSFNKNFPAIHHLSKHLMIQSGKETNIKKVMIFRKLLNLVQIYEENHKVIAKSLNMTKRMPNFETFESSQQENLSQILFPDKTKNINGKKLFAAWHANDEDTQNCSGCLRPNCKWNFFLDIVVEKINATLEFKNIPVVGNASLVIGPIIRNTIEKHIYEGRLDFYLSSLDEKFALHSYNNEDWCYMAPMPEPYSITELILFMPMDKSCWMWLGITIAVSTLIWRISEGHWNFAFGAFSYFMGQAQLSVRIRTNRLTMKILLQLLIFAIFIFSNGYQSLVTSFMLNPAKVRLIETLEGLFESDLMIQYNEAFHRMYNNNPKYLAAYQTGHERVRYINVPFAFEKQAEVSIQDNMAMLHSCKHKRFEMDRTGYKNLSGLYLIQENALSGPSDLYIKPFHPFIESFQELMDRSFQAGLHQAWERFFFLKLSESYPRKKIEEDSNILDLKLIAPFFLILVFGSIAALLTLWCEIFWKDFVSEISKEYIRRKFDELFRRRPIIERTKREFKIVQVKPKQMIMKAMNDIIVDHHQNFSLLLDFTCALAKDELEKHPDMRTIAMVELENNFPSEFSREVLKCLPVNIAKILIDYENNYVINLPKETLIIFVADVIHFEGLQFTHIDDYATHVNTFHHRSKHLIVSSKEEIVFEPQNMLQQLLNVAQIYEENGKIVAKGSDRKTYNYTFVTFESSQRENLSQILFPDKTRNLNGQRLLIFWMHSFEVHLCKNCIRPNTKWIFYLDLIADKMNATLEYYKLPSKTTDEESFVQIQMKYIEVLSERCMLDFYLNSLNHKLELNSYSYNDWCFSAPLPKPYKITDQILFLPLDKSCWMWLGITIAVSTLVWRISEGHWDFPFGSFSYLMGQAQLVVRIRTNRLTMKILLQFLIFTFFIFSNGYQSIVTSFMLDPVKIPFLKTIEELLDSNLNIEYVWNFHGINDDNPKYQKAFHNGRILHLDYSKVPYNNSNLETKMHLARPVKCKIRGYEKTYMIEETAYTFPDDLYIVQFNPFLDRYQELMDQTFEAGLHQEWERLYHIKLSEEFVPAIPKDDRNDILDMSLIAPFFVILAIGFFAALLILLLEIFDHDFVSEITMEYLKRKWKERFGKRKKKKVEKLQVRRIQVQPKIRRRSI